MNPVDAVRRYAEGGGVPEQPQTVHMDLINTCNLKCPMCWNHSPLLETKKDPGWKKLKLSFADYKTILSDLKNMGVRKLILSGGGEPFCHKKIYRMIALAVRKKFRVTVLTNARLVEPAVLRESPPDKLLVNLPVMDEALFVKFYPKSGKGTLADLLLKLKELAGFTRLTLVMVVTSWNYMSIPEYIRRAGDLGEVRVSFKLANLPSDLKELSLADDMKTRLLDTIIPEAEALCLQYGIPHDLDLFRARLNSDPGQFLAARTGCYAGLLYSRIYVTGDVFYCCAHIAVGNALETPLSVLWTGETYNALRRRLAAGNFFPQCRNCGKINMNYSVFNSLQEHRV
ncbi:MAG: radical SAM protein [Spirochaetales bacterium]|nr:radical SAM protein [Spirochaetales bacterium]